MAKAQTFSVFNPSIWSPKVTAYFREKLVAGAFFADYSGDIATEGDKLYIPALAQRFTIGDIKVTSGEVAATDISDTSVYLDIDTWKGGGFFLTKFQQAQMRKSYKAQARYMKGIAFDLAKTIDTALYALTTSASLTDSIGDSGTNILATTLEYGISILESDSIPLTECSFFFHPYAWYREVQANSDLRRATYYGEKRLPNLTKLINLYGLPVKVTSQIPGGDVGLEGGHRNLLIHNESLVYAVQSPIGLAELRGEDLRVKVVGDAIYGMKKLRSDAGIRIISNN